MNRYLVLAYGILAYLAFNLSFLYFAAFSAGLVGPVAEQGPVAAAVAIDVGLVLLFGVTHSVMARDGFKRWLSRFLPEAAERSTYVLQSAVFLGIAVLFWQPIPGTIWSVTGTGQWLILCCAALGLSTVLLASFLLDHFELFGLFQIWCHLTGREMPAPQMRTPFLYRVVRHPLQTGIAIMMVATPEMTTDRLLFGALMLCYILVGLWFEERALRRTFGKAYEDYAAQVPMLIPTGRIWRGTAPVAAE